MKVKIKTWCEMEKEFGLTNYGSINVFGGFTKNMDELLPPDRMIEIIGSRWYAGEEVFFIIPDMISQDARISEDKIYKTESGLGVRIYADTGVYIHGAIQSELGIWSVHSWDCYGQTCESDLCLVEVFQPKAGEWHWFYGGDMLYPELHQFKLMDGSKYVTSDNGSACGTQTFSYCLEFTGEVPCISIQ